MANNGNIYIDGSATTPPRKEVIEKISEVELNTWGNPSSINYHGIQAAEVLERSRKIISTTLAASLEEVIFTSGATESIHLAILGLTTNTIPGRIVISSVEHPAVESAAKKLKLNGWELAHCSVDKYGQINLNHLESLLTHPTKIVSIVWGQSEVGTIQPIFKIGEMCHSKGILFHTDATQILSQSLFNWSNLPVDVLSASAHKFQGPKGIGFLLCKKGITNSIIPLIGGGKQENGVRSGTQPVAQIAGMAVAIQFLEKPLKSLPDSNFTEYDLVCNQTTRLRAELKEAIKWIKFTGHKSERLKNHISMLIGTSDHQPLPGSQIVRELSKRGLSASSGTACQSGRLQDSQTLHAMNIPAEWRKSGLRFSLGSWLTENDIDRIPGILRDTIQCISNK